MGLVLPPNEVFTYQRLPLAKNQGGYGTYNWQKDVCPPEGGIFAYYTDEPYPRKGHTYPEAAEANNIIKKLTIGSLVALAAPQAILPVFGFLLLPWKQKVKWLERILINYCRMADYTLRSHYMKRQFYNNFGKELWNLTYHFLRHIGISTDTAYRCGKIVAHLFEHDDAYRARVQDVVTEMSKGAMMVNPGKEIMRLTQIYLSREKEGIDDKFLAVAKITTFLLKIPKFKKIFLEVLKQADMKNLRNDEIDYYWVLNRGGYNFLGREDEDRYKEYKDRHNRFVLTKFRKQIEESITDEEGKKELQEQLINLGLT